MNSRIKTNKRTNALHCHRPSTIDAQYTEKILWNSALIKNNFPRKMFCFLQAATQVVPPLDWHQNWHSKYTRLTLAETPTSCWSQLDFRCIWPGCQKCFWAKKWNCKVNRSDSELNRKRTLRLFGCVNWHDDHNLFGWSWRKLTSNRFLGGAARIVLVQCFTKNIIMLLKKYHTDVHTKEERTTASKRTHWLLQSCTFIPRQTWNEKNCAQGLFEFTLQELSGSRGARMRGTTEEATKTGEFSLQWHFTWSTFSKNLNDYDSCRVVVMPHILKNWKEVPRNLRFGNTRSTTVNGLGACTRLRRTLKLSNVMNYKLY